MGYCDVLPFQIDLKPGTRPLKQRPYRHNPVVSGKIAIEQDKVLAAGIMRHSISNWDSPMIAAVKPDGGVRLTCYYKKLIDATIIPVLPIL